MSNYPILAKEGRVHLILALVAGLGATWAFGWWSIPVWLITLFVFQFFRDPPRTIDQSEGAIVSPASGQVVSIGEEDNPYIEGQRALKVSVFMNVFSVHSNLVPIGGTIINRWYKPGKFFNAALDKASTENERNAIWIKTEDGQDVVSVQIAGLIARRIFSYVEPGDKVETGQRYGFIRFGSRVDIYLPVNTRLSIKMGQWLASGNDLIGKLEKPA